MINNCRKTDKEIFNVDKPKQIRKNDLNGQIFFKILKILFESYLIIAIYCFIPSDFCKKSD
ncbi:hypothetical protein C7N43_16380 [Sphingobacteriales bacterium UPWRP_1]|nr:hypothetical protein B6N25_02745 [Sphingobacteriales bacterium TSM_CSS]PSJ75970.1 hypothetical protein C7N43_16380 [Sphingobacteriales bacterium UPWRP_1]